jgi:hypothetical protein
VNALVVRALVFETSCLMALLNFDFPRQSLVIVTMKYHLEAPHYHTNDRNLSLWLATDVSVTGVSRKPMRRLPHHPAATQQNRTKGGDYVIKLWSP